MQSLAKLGARRVFFMHVVKTGGTSLSAFLQHAFRPEEICPAPPGNGFWSHAPADVAHYRFFSGHFNAEFIDAVDDTAFRITVLRDPIERVVSLYDFWRSIPPEWSQNVLEGQTDEPAFARSTSFVDFLKAERMRPTLSNTTARQLLGARYPLYEHDLEALTNEAAGVLRRFDLVLTTAKLSQTLPLLSSQFEIPMPGNDTLHLNRTPYGDGRKLARTIPSPTEFALIRSFSKADVFLYEMAARSEAAWMKKHPAGAPATIWAKLKHFLPV